MHIVQYFSSPQGCLEHNTAMTQLRKSSAIKAFGSGHIVFWRGGSLWLGRSDETGFHDHHAIQIAIAPCGSVLRLRCPDQDWIEQAAAIVAANQPHAFEGGGERVALVFVEPESRAGRILKQRYGHGIRALDADLLTGEAAALAAAFEQGLTTDGLVRLAQAVVTRLTALEPLPPQPLDPRILRAIEAIRARLDQAVSMAQIAEAVHLSPERFRHLFLQQTGIRFRPYVLWLRMELAVGAYAGGSSLTDAAQAGGFADSAHFSRTFKRMFGVPAVSVQRAG